MADPGADSVTITGILTGLVALPFIAYRAYQGLKSDRKGDNVDERISAFTSNIQSQLDKAIARSDQLQKDYTDVAAKLASAQARAEYLAQENSRLLAELQQLRATTVKIATTAGAA